MKFIDEAVITVSAGHGGKGCISFRREKYVPRGGPDGGNGGKGGDIIMRTEPGMSTLMDLKYRKSFHASKGAGGKGSNQDGHAGEDVVILVPVGTLVYNQETHELMADLKEPNQFIVIARGGRGGKGNAFFTTSTRQAPRFAQEGEEEENFLLRLELKLLADVGLIGQPNAGKSTFLSVVSKARPKIADYPFTTLSPLLGVVQYKGFPPFTIADIPGLIEGAHQGKGLGIQFLKHVERTKFFLHLVSLGPDELGAPFERFQMIKKELESYSASFKKRKQVIALTKLDLISSKKELKEMMAPFKKKRYPVFAISAVTGEGVEELVEYLVQNIRK